MTEPHDPLPFLSIIIPVLNVARTVRDLMDSLMELDYPRDRMEVLAVDGGSTDGTREIVREYPVRLLDQEGRGLNAARNTGLKYSRGEIVAFTDGDCVVPPNWPRAIARNFQDPRVSFVGGTLQGYDKSEPLSVYLDETFFQVSPFFRWRTETTDLHLLHFPAGANMAFRKRVLERINFFDERIVYGFDDLEPVEKLGLRGFRIVLDPDVMVWHQHRTTLRAMLKQHFNYGRGGGLLLVHKRASQLAKWYAAYLISTTFGTIFLLFMLVLGIWLRHMLPIQIALGTVLIGFLVIQAYYLSSAVKQKTLWKVFAYPALDFLRGVCLTLGGLSQLVKSTGRRVI